ncbi:MAG: MBOAT family O-acyltransferase [Saprospiraceae bacterium]
MFVLYWFVFNKHLRAQNALLLVASYVFYGWWDWKFLGLLFLSSVMDFSLGLLMGKTTGLKNRKLLMILSLVFNLGLLGTFKYFNFFVQSFIDAFSSVGIVLESHTLKIILPVGISFYTFQSLSYTIDVYRRQMEPVKDLFSFLAFVSFFPQLVAGPIERAANLLPQFSVQRHFSYEKSVDGLRQGLWGLFKKVVIADNCAIYANGIFENYAHLSGSELLLGVFFFAIQIYCDFSGYSDIAIGTAKLFGFELMTNFRYPYFSRDMAEFWRRWHISLSTWFRDYVYIPLGGNRVVTTKAVRNIFIVFLLSGFWHGANWTFIVWGGLNAVYFLPLFLSKKHRKNLEFSDPAYLLPPLKEVFQIGFTFLLTCLAWLFFRSNSVGQALDYLFDIFRAPFLPANFWYFNHFSLAMVALLFAVEWLGRQYDHPFQAVGIARFRPVRWGMYVVMSFMVLNFFHHNSEFIYFQF